MRRSRQVGKLVKIAAETVESWVLVRYGLRLTHPTSA